jgi:hypothetical protein
MTLGDKTQINGVWYEVVSYTDGPFRRTMHLVECEGPKEGEDDERQNDND